jgi:hypothetical protein
MVLEVGLGSVVELAQRLGVVDASARVLGNATLA